MPYKIERFKPHWLLIATKTVTAGGTETIEHTFDDDLVINRLFIWASDGSSLYDVLLTIRIEDEYVTHDSVPAELFNTDQRDAYELKWSVGKGEKLYISITNNKTTNVTLYVLAEVTK